MQASQHWLVIPLKRQVTLAGSKKIYKLSEGDVGSSLPANVTAYIVHVPALVFILQFS
jgi:hypothetical protein